MSDTTRTWTWVAIAIALAVVAAVVVVVTNLWDSVGDDDISLLGWLAMAFGVLATLGLGTGLMTLVFISNRRGYDDFERKDH
ncbi:MAG: hypothetical protein ACREFK_00175 [Stellaceae bacterium]